jgi:hypothetical protein
MASCEGGHRDSLTAIRPRSPDSTFTSRMGLFEFYQPVKMRDDRFEDTI